MKSTLPFFAFVSLHITPYANQSIKNDNASEYLPAGNNVQSGQATDHEAPPKKIMKYNNEQAEYNNNISPGKTGNNFPVFFVCGTQKQRSRPG